MALILNMPMQDNATGPPGLVIDDVSASNNDANFGVVNTEDINVAGPGGAYPRALNFGGAALAPDGAQFQTTIETNTSNRTVGFFAKLSIGENNPIFGS